MRVAFFNWRDIRNPLAGGAEVFVHNVLARLVMAGHRATLFTSSYPGSCGREAIDGIEHIRYGGRYAIFPRAPLCYRKHIRGRFDAIVESINGVPFFMPLFAKEKVVPFIHQMTRENWHSGIAFPLSYAGYYLEDAMLSPYRSCRAIAPSESTRADLLALGFRDVTVIHGAADMRPPERAKEKARTIVYLGRLAKSKRVDHALRAFAIISSNFGGARMLIAGSGPEEARLKHLSCELGISESVEFLGKVGEGEKADLLARSHLALFPAVREGWGLVVLEANTCATPVLGYDVPGLRDSIQNGVNGYLVPDGDFKALSRRAISLLNDEPALRKLSISSKEHSGKFSWDKAAERFGSLLEEVVS